MLYDTGGTRNNGSLMNHQFIKDKFSMAVAKYEELNGDNPINPIKFLGPLLEPNDPDTEKRGILSASGAYYTPIISTGEIMVLLSFALWYNISVDIIIGLLFVKEVKLELYLNLYLLYLYDLKK